MSEPELSLLDISLRNQITDRNNRDTGIRISLRSELVLDSVYYI